MMRLPIRDAIATCAVGAAVVLYLLWTVDTTLPGMGATRATAVAVLVLGFVASAIAVVPAFDGLMHGNKEYLAVTSILGLAALVSGVIALWAASETALAVLMIMLVVLWMAATTHHAVLARAERPAPRDRWWTPGHRHGHAT